VLTSDCKAKMICIDRGYDYVHANFSLVNENDFPVESAGEATTIAPECVMAPAVQCGTNESTWTPLFNLHVHSKQTKLYMSSPCKCSTSNQITRNIRSENLGGFAGNGDAPSQNKANMRGRKDSFDVASILGIQPDAVGSP
jgi:hypothetical protein